MNDGYELLPWIEILNRHTQDNSKYISASQMDNYNKALGDLTEMYNPKTISDITSKVIKDYAYTLLNSKNLAPSTTKKTLAALHAFFAWAYREDYCTRIPPFPKIKTSRSPNGRALTDAEYTLFLACVPHEWKFYIRGLRYSGLRLKESTLLSWDEKEFPHIDHSQSRRMMVFPRKYNKSGVEDVVPVTPQMDELLDETPESERTGKVLIKHLYDRYRVKNPLIKRVPRDPARTCWNAVNKAARLSDIWVTPKKRVSPHDLRRTFATYWAQRLTVAQLQKMMRHSSYQTTMQYYIQLDPNTLAESLWAHEVPEPI